MADEKIIKTFDKILEEQDIILVDGSLRKEEGNGIGWDIYDAKRYDEINLKILEETKQAFLDFISILKNEKVFTIREVSGEIEKLEKILNKKKRVSDENRQARYRGYYELFAIKARRRKERESNGELALTELQELVYQTRKIAERKNLLFDEKYSILFKMAWQISEKIKLKKDTSHFLGTHLEDKSYQSNTDEKLFSAILWLSLFSDKKPALLTRDTDFVRLFGVIPRIMGSDDFNLYNKFFRKRLKENPFSLYMRENENTYSLAVTSANARYEKEFRIINTTETENTKLKGEIQTLWQKMCE